MVKREIVWTQTAVKQRRQILKYWIDHNKSNLYAIKLVEIIADHLKVISKNPKAFKESELPLIHEAAMAHLACITKSLLKK